MKQENIERTITIKNLAECLWCAPLAAHWSFTEWYVERNIPFAVNLAAYQKRGNLNSVPLCHILFLDDLPIGMGSLKENDLWTRKDLNPWLASVYIIPQMRNRGYGKILISSLEEKAWKLGIEQLFLFLGQHEQSKLSHFYSALGWTQFDEAVDNDGKPTMIFMKKKKLIL